MERSAFYALEEQTLDLQVGLFTIRLWITANNNTDDKFYANIRTVNRFVAEMPKGLTLFKMCEYFSNIPDLATVQVKMNVENGIEVGHSCYKKGFDQKD